MSITLERRLAHVLHIVKPMRKSGRFPEVLAVEAVVADRVLADEPELLPPTIHLALEKVGDAQPGTLPWAIIKDVDSANTDDKVFSMEPWCSVKEALCARRTSSSRSAARHAAGPPSTGSEPRRGRDRARRRQPRATVPCPDS